jgi:hypothetical protein
MMPLRRAALRMRGRHTAVGRPFPVDGHQAAPSARAASIRRMLALTPWSIARCTTRGRRAVLLLLLAALLYGFGVHAARACAPQGVPAAHVAAPCHGAEGVDTAEAACAAHCSVDTLSGRGLPHFDLPAAAPLPAVLTPVAPALLATFALPPPPRGDTGPPLHLLLHRLLR